ncbi:MAG: polyprenyl synthetase family protein [Proteobacteria bacterium]|nr:polyprenyl synthetase family protein [Pseudomonadota bacterium]
MAEAAAAVDGMLDRLLPRPADAESRLAEAMRYAALGPGKRLRPFLVITGSRLFNVATTSALRVAAAVEMVHAYSLVHDDLPAMDDDEMRRGRPTVHVAFDEATAILAGDGLLTRAFEVLADPLTHSNPAVCCQLIAALADAAGARGMVGGQMIDLMAEHQRLDQAEITRLQMLKTGKLIGFSCEAGAILGRAPAQQRFALQAYAHDLGLAFQIADDLLDIAGDAGEMGKAASKDAAAGKATLVALIGPERARAHARLLARQAVQHLDSFDEKADLLRHLARFVVERRT